MEWLHGTLELDPCGTVHFEESSIPTGELGIVFLIGMPSQDIWGLPLFTNSVAGVLGTAGWLHGTNGGLAVGDLLGNVAAVNGIDCSNEQFILEVNG